MQVIVEKGSVLSYLYRYGQGHVDSNWDYLVKITEKCSQDEVLIIQFETFDEALSCQKLPEVIKCSDCPSNILDQINVQELRNKNIFLLILYIKELNLYRRIIFPSKKTHDWVYLGIELGIH